MIFRVLGRRIVQIAFDGLVCLTSCINVGHVQRDDSGADEGTEQLQ